jgi:hypothetical protein
VQNALRSSFALYCPRSVLGKGHLQTLCAMCVDCMLSVNDFRSTAYCGSQDKGRASEIVSENNERLSHGPSADGNDPDIWETRWLNKTHAVFFWPGHPENFSVPA